MSEELKYKNGEDLIIKAKVIHASPDNPLDYRLVIGGIYGSHFSEGVLDNLVIETPQKPKVKQEVMDWYEEVKSERADWTIVSWLRYINIPSEVCDWLYGENHLENQHAIVTLITYGPEAVEVEKEKIYKVYLKHTNQELLYYEDTDDFYFDHINKENITKSFTKQELIEAGFGGVFDNEMFEVEEVE